MVDISIAIALALVTIGMGYLGIHVTLHPVDSQRARTCYKIGFWSLAFGATTLIAWQAYRNVQNQNTFQQQLSDIKQQGTKTGSTLSDLHKGPLKVEVINPRPTEAPLRAHIHIVRFELHPLIPDQPVKVNVYFKNNGRVPADWQGYYYMRFIESPGDIEGTGLEDKLFAEMKKSIKPTKVANNTIPVDAERFITDVGPRLTANRIAGLQKGKSVLYFMGTFRYRDRGGIYYSTYCGFIHGEPGAIFMCHKYNDEP